MTSKEIYLNFFDADIVMSASGTHDESIVSLPNDDDETATFYMPLDYMKQLFTIHTESHALTETIASDTSELIYRHKVDDKLHINPARATILTNTRPTGAIWDTSANKTIPEVPWATKDDLWPSDPGTPDWWYDTTKYIYPEQNDVEHDFLRFIAASKFRTHTASGHFTNQKDLINDIYNILEDVWDEHQTLLFSTNTDGYYEMHDNDANRETMACRTIYQSLINQDPARFKNLSGKQVTNTAHADISGNNIVYEYEMPFVAGDTLIYFINIISKETSQFPRVSRKYKIQIIITDVGVKHTLSSDVLTKVEPSQTSKPYTTNPFANNIVGIEFVGYVDQHGLCFTPVIPLVIPDPNTEAFRTMAKQAITDNNTSLLNNIKTALNNWISAQQQLLNIEFIKYEESQDEYTQLSDLSATLDSMQYSNMNSIVNTTPDDVDDIVETAQAYVADKASSGLFA